MDQIEQKWDETNVRIENAGNDSSIYVTEGGVLEGKSNEDQASEIDGTAWYRSEYSLGLQSVDRRITTTFDLVILAVLEVHLDSCPVYVELDFFEVRWVFFGEIGLAFILFFTSERKVTVDVEDHPEADIAIALWVAGQGAMLGTDNA